MRSFLELVEHALGLQIRYNIYMLNRSIPPYVLKYFWGDDLKELDLQKNNTYIIQTLLEKGDKEAIKWLFSTLGINTIKNTLPTLKLSRKSQQFWNLYLS